MVKFLAVYDNPNGERHAKVYYDWEQYFNDTFSPMCNRAFILDLSGIKGSSKQEKKEYLRAKAIEFYNNYPDLLFLKWSEYHEIGNFFTKYGKQYGLLKEFQAKGIC